MKSTDKFAAYVCPTMERTSHDIMILATEASSSTTSPFTSIALELCLACDQFHADPKAKDLLGKITDQRRKLASLVAALPASSKASPDALGVTGVLEKMMKTGVLDHALAAEDAATLRSLNVRSWSGLMAGMILSPAWAWTQAPALDDVPNWLWPLFTRYIFHVPQSFTAVGEAEKYAAHHLRRLTELERWVSVNKGSSTVRAALDTYLQNSNCIPLYFSESSLKKHYELRAKLISAALNLPKQMDLSAFPRDGRKLRIGFIKMHWAPQTETYSTMPTFERLDKEKYDVCLYTLKETDTPVEQHLKGVAAEFHVLNGGVEEQVQTLLAANLDVAVFATNVTAVTNDILFLALHRVAPLQVMHHPSCTTTGLPEIDLYVSGDLTESAVSPGHFVERLALLPGPSHAFNYEVDRQEAVHRTTREELGVKEGEILFVSAANYYKIIPEMMHAWAKLLAQVPGAKLLVHPFNPNWSNAYPIQRFCAEFDRVLESHGVPSGALLISTAKYPSRADVKELLALGDVYLDTFPFSGVNSLIDPLECGVPTLVWEGETFRARMASAVLKQIGVPELIATSAEQYQTLALRLATDATWRTALREKITTAMASCPLFMDTLAASDAFGSLMELAYDRLVVEGREQFRRDRSVLQVTAENLDSALTEIEGSLSLGLAGQAWDRIQPLLGAHPADARLRRLAGRALTALGRADRGSQYLLESIQGCNGDTAQWCELAACLLQVGNLKNAMEAVQICLQLDAKNIEALLLLGEIADRAGQLDLIEEVVTSLQQLAPDDLRVLTLASKVALATQTPQS